MPLNIYRCLDIFTAKEHISEAYCGRCKTHRAATKTMDLWRLPPLLVIQLKRFCYTQTSRRKLHHFVDFPLTGLRLEDYVAKKRDPRRMHESGLVYWRFLGGKLADCGPPTKQTDQCSPKQGVASHDFKSNKPVPTSLLHAPAAATDRSEDQFVYDLYAVVNHVGALGAGHYFAYILSQEDSKWKCFNDHQCKDIDTKEVISSSAYILFYRRRDVKEVAIEDIFPPIRRSSSKDSPGNEDVVEVGNSAEDQAIVEELVEKTKAATNSGSSGCTIS
ncbi:hypothetical protein PINS_up005076 [Pythium insidiosum]|nr:hypothetical protein PINS_up005076 [Pythium insidiosum]